MDTIAAFAAIVAAIASIIAIFSSERNSKRHILKKIIRLEERKRKIAWEQDKRFGFRRPLNLITPADEKIAKLDERIEWLKQLL